jgi:Flp pilus assembly protein TadG
MAFVKDTRGTEVVEFALVLPILLFVFAGLVDMGFLFNSYEVITNAAREGARLAAVPGHPNEDIETRVAEYVAGAGLDTAKVKTDVLRPVAIDVGGGTVNGVTVTVTYDHTYFILGGIAELVGGSDTFDMTTLTAVSTMRTELAGS